nr:YrrS family protein [Neobacillus sp. Marseille-Q6967]
MSNDFQSGSRSGYRAKRKKTNIILNSLIVIVLALIVIVAFSIFSSGDDQASKQTEPKTEEKQVAKQEDKEKDNTDKTENPADEDTAAEEEESEETAAPEDADESQAIVTEGDGSSNVVKTIENPSWQPVGTEQTGVHEPVYDDTSVDWQEMLKAISYATGLDQSSMTVYWLGRDKSTANASVGTVYSKETQEKYRVYITWVDGEGWKPTRVEELAELER